MLLREYLDGGQRLTPEIMAEIGEFFATTKAIVTDGIREGEFREVDPHAVHLSLIGSLTFLLTSRTWRGRFIDLFAIRWNRRAVAVSVHGER